MKKISSEGHHIIGELSQCDEKMRYPDFVLKEAYNACRIAGLEVIGNSNNFFPYHDTSDEGKGLTSVYILSQSLFAVHTWPEKLYVSLDVFACGEDNDIKSGIALIYFASRVNAKYLDVAYILRGIKKPPYSFMNFDEEGSKEDKGDVYIHQIKIPILHIKNPQYDNVEKLLRDIKEGKIPSSLYELFAYIDRK